jgi:phosphate transport system permease protein
VTSLALPDGLGPPLPRRSLRARRAWNSLALGTCVLAAGVLCVPIALLVWHLFVLGLPQLRPGFFVHQPRPVGELGGGMANAIAGTLILVGIGTAIAVPIGVGAGIYLAGTGGGLRGWPPVRGRAGRRAVHRASRSTA